MNMDIFNQIKEFVEKERWKYKFPLTRDTTLSKDLGIYGDDAVDFIIEYGKAFNVDIKNFMAADYFEDEGIDFIGSILWLMSGKKKKQVDKKKTLTLGHLEKGILAGRLDEKTINS